MHYWLAPDAATAAEAAVSEAAVALDAASDAEAAASLAVAAALEAAAPASEAATVADAAASLAAAALELLESSFLPQAPSARAKASVPATMRVLFMITSLLWLKVSYRAKQPFVCTTSAKDLKVT